MTRPLMSETRTAVLGALLASIGPISMAIYTPAMPELVRAFATTEGAIKMSLSLYFAGFACAQLLAGPVSDAFGRRKATIGFLIIYLAGSLIAFMAPTVEVLIAGRLIQGIGSSVGITVSRAIVRDQFTGAEAARILNLVGIILAVGPAMGPTLGGLALALSGWAATFVIMITFGLVAILVVLTLMPETGTPQRALIAPPRLISAYAMLIADWRVTLPAICLGGTIGALYAQSTMLPFILINRVGFTPAEFGASMLMQTVSYFLGSLALRRVGRRLGTWGPVTAGMVCAGLAALATALSVEFLVPSFYSIMLPVGLAAFGFAFLTPQITTSGLAPHPQTAGSAAALMGFVQMSSGFAGGMAASLLGDPLKAFGTVIPGMLITGVAAYLLLRLNLARR